MVAGAVLVAATWSALAVMVAADWPRASRSATNSRAPETMFWRLHQQGEDQFAMEQRMLRR